VVKVMQPVHDGGYNARDLCLRERRLCTPQHIRDGGVAELHCNPKHTALRETPEATNNPLRLALLQQRDLRGQLAG